MTDRLDGRVLLALQALVLGLPLFLGGRHPAAVACAAVVVLLLLALTVRERRRRGDARHAPGVAALAAFAVLALVTTLPVPPALLRVLTPAAARLYADTLPGWPGGGGWTLWRSLAIDPYGVWLELGRLSIGLGVFAVVVAYPWREVVPYESAQARVFARLVITLLAGGTLVAGLGVLEQVGGNGNVLWVTDNPATPGRASGPFVNPNHFAAWLEMIIPSGLAYAIVLMRRLRRRLVRSTETGRGMGVQRRRAWVAALVVHQQRLWAPAVALTAVLLMFVAHVASGSRGGAAALLAGLGVAGGGMLTRRSGKRRGTTVRRWAPLVLGAGLTLAAAASIVAWAIAERDQPATAATDADVSLASRLSLTAKGIGLVQDFPVFGTGLGSWLHAFRPYVAPPIEGGIWDHAHDDYIEVAADTGVTGAVLVVLFALAVARSIRRKSSDGAEWVRKDEMPRGFEPPDWYAALGEASYLRWGLVGGLVAILVHSTVDFSLHMPANLLVAMLLLALLVLSGRPQPEGRTPALATLLVALALPLVPQGTNAVLVLAGGSPISPRDCLDKADVVHAEDREAARDEALALLHRALDGSPADREVHEQLAEILGPGPEGDAALRRALALEPWSAEVRDRLALRLLDQGDAAAGNGELEEAMYRFPYLASHYYLSPDLDAELGNPTRLVRALAEGDTLAVRLASLEGDRTAAIERGLRHALDQTVAGDTRAAIVDDLAGLLEARERWTDAASLLAADAQRSLDSGANLARAARDYLKARDYAAAEQNMLAAVVHSPAEGGLYHDLAVDVYAARGDYAMAENVLEAGERNAIDMLPVYNGVAQVVAQRESARGDDFVGPIAPREREQEEIVP